MHQNFVKHVVEGPDIGGPVGMAQAPFKGEEPGQDLWELTLKTRESCQGVGVKSNSESLKYLTKAINGPKDRKQTEVTMLPRASRRSGLKPLQMTEPSACNKLSLSKVLL